MTIRKQNGVLYDDNHNSASIGYWGSEEAARKALESLVNCSYCVNCRDCTGCTGCTDCTGCFDCTGCYGCSRAKSEKQEFKVPVIADIHKIIYSAVSQPKALDMSNWHTCETMHCRAGWVVTLAGEAGRELEKNTSTLFAAQQIYKASGYEISPVRFFDSDEDALADMKRLAERESE